jgi:flagellar biosynthesis/type III secretory pathway protein FliH
MDAGVTVQLSAPIRPIRSIHVVTEGQTQTPAEDETRRLRAELESTRAQVEGRVRQLDEAAAQIRAFQEEHLQACRDQVIHLAVGIAERILAKQINSGEYDIERIVAEALEQAPTDRKIVVRLHPADLEALKQLVADGGTERLQHVEMVADPQLGRAECAVDTEQVTLEHRVEEHLRQIEQALKAGATP